MHSNWCIEYIVHKTLNELPKMTEMRMSDNKLNYVFDYVFWSRESDSSSLLVFQYVLLSFVFCFLTLLLIYCECVGHLLLLVFIPIQYWESINSRCVCVKLLLDATASLRISQGIHFTSINRNDRVSIGWQKNSAYFFHPSIHSKCLRGNTK